MSDRANASNQRRNHIERELSDAQWACKSAETPSEFKGANEWLQRILELLKDKTERMLHDDHQACWERWVELKEILKNRRTEISDFHYGKFAGEAYEAKGLAADHPKDAKDRVRAVQSNMKGRVMDRWQYEEVNKILDEAWSVASARQEQRRADGQHKMREAKSRKLEVRERKEEQLRAVYRNIDANRDKLYDARSSEFRSRVEGWIDEGLARARELEASIADLDAVIRDIDSKLD
jgi:hypothetical protein